MFWRLWFSCINYNNGKFSGAGSGGGSVCGCDMVAKTEIQSSLWRMFCKGRGRSIGFIGVEDVSFLPVVMVFVEVMVGVIM